MMTPVSDFEIVNGHFDLVANATGSGEAVDILLEGNEKLNATLAEFMAPLVTRSSVEINGIGAF